MGAASRQIGGRAHLESPVEVRRQGLPPVTSCRSRAEVEPPCRARVLAVEARVVAVEPRSSPRRAPVAGGTGSLSCAPPVVHLDCVLALDSSARLWTRR